MIYYLFFHAKKKISLEFFLILHDLQCECVLREQWRGEKWKGNQVTSIYLDAKIGNRKEGERGKKINL
jgi:hypothetical protein